MSDADITFAEHESDEAKQNRAVQCGKELEALLAKWNCNIDVGMKVFAGRNEPIVNIVPK
jgi:hypothetical protein